MFSELRQTKISAKPSPYPPLPFHALRLFQLLSALITSSILCFFIYYLRDEKPPLPVPWTFIFLLTAALLTLPVQGFTLLLKSQGTLNPRISLYSNIALTVIWVLGLSLLCWNLSWTLGHTCTIESWSSENGVMVCRMYKALAAFAVTGTAASIGALFLDLSVNRSERRAGVYGMMQLPEKDRDDKTPWRDQVNDLGAAHQGDAMSRGALWDGDHTGITRAWRAKKMLNVGDFGYAVPEGQTTYGGGGGENTEISMAHL